MRLLQTRKATLRENEARPQQRLERMQGFFWWTPTLIVSWNGIILENIWKLNAINSSLSIIEYLISRHFVLGSLVFIMAFYYWLTPSNPWLWLATVDKVRLLMVCCTFAIIHKCFDGGTRDLRYLEISLSFILKGFMTGIFLIILENNEKQVLFLYKFIHFYRQQFKL